MHILLDRFLAVIESFEIQPIICLTKKDFASEKELEEVEIAATYYEKIGYKVMKTFIDDEDITGNA